ncbi:MAG: SAM-dependent methyltransferase, partial [Acidobacteriota bacterium]|nr:SAM-dependent methyltransferase [Acidobacteriota bacterium]
MTLREVIRERIRTEGPLPFAAFAELALYHPELGYYARVDRRSGRAGDFFTSVDLGPAFGSLLASQLAEMWRILRSGSGDPGFDLVEAAAGNGRLARDVLDAAAADDPAFYQAIRLHLVEPSRAARDAQAATLGRHADKVASSGSRIPPAIRGAVFANE